MDKSINLFSKAGLTILTVLTAPIFTVMILGNYYPKTWESIVNRMGWARVESSKVVQPSKAVQPAIPSNRTFLGRSTTGYELWTDGSCVYVKGLRESDIDRLNTTISGFKEAVKLETGKKCVLFE